MRTNILAACLVLAAAALPGRAQPGSSEEEMQRAADIQARLVAWLGPDAQTIQAVAVGSRVFLSGVVESRVTQELADEVTLAAPGVRSTRNRITLHEDKDRLSDHLREEGHDVLLEIRVKRALQREGLALARALEVEAVDGVVSLRGIVESRERRDLALEIAGKVDGVTRVLDLVGYRETLVHDASAKRAG